MRRRSLPPIVMALCLIGGAGLNYGGLQGLLTLIESEPLPEREEVTYIELTPDDGRVAMREEPEREEPEREEPEPKLDPLQPKPEEPEPPEPANEEEPEPDEELPPPEPDPEPEPEEQQPFEFEFVLEQLKMVEQPDQLDEEDAPEDVDYLSNINRDVVEQTRAEVTNLQEDSVQTKARELEPTEETERGTADESVIAEDEHKESQVAKQAPDVRPDKVEMRPEQKDENPQALQLAMRELEQRDHRAAAAAHDALAEEAADGVLRPEQDWQASIAEQEQRARIDRKDPRYAFKLSGKQLDALFGEKIDAKKRSEHKEQSKKRGIWEDAQAHWQSPLENMVPEVKVGNQTALRSRKHPFAKYITKIHRGIHEAWAWGFLEQLDTRGRKHQLNDYDLWTRVEIVLTRDGEIDKITTVRHSGNLAFDAAAREVLYSIGPFPGPPPEIMSGNGKVYIHWAFHRDERACGTFGAQPFILDNAGRGDRPDPRVEIRPGKGGGKAEGPVRRLKRGEGGGYDHSGHAHGPPGPVGPSLPPSTGGSGSDAGKSGSKGSGEHGGGTSLPRLPGRGTGDGGDSSDGGDERPAPPSSKDQAADPNAAKAANAWFADLVRGNVTKLAARSTLPFYSGSTIVARTKEERADILEAMSGEVKAGGKPKATKTKVYTAAGLRQVFGSVPEGVQEGSGHVYALGKVNGDYLVLILQKKFGAWRVVGTTR